MFFSRKNSANSREYQLNPKLDNERYSVCQIFPPNFVTLEWAELETSGPIYQLARISTSYPRHCLVDTVYWAHHIENWSFGSCMCSQKHFVLLLHKKIILLLHQGVQLALSCLIDARRLTARACVCESI